MSMYAVDIEGAMREARRFITAAEAALTREAEKKKYSLVEGEGYRYAAKYPDGLPYNAVIGYTKESGALKRASLDLTRTLADLRRS